MNSTTHTPAGIAARALVGGLAAVAALTIAATPATAALTSSGSSSGSSTLSAEIPKNPLAQALWAPFGNLIWNLLAASGSAGCMAGGCDPGE
ncbi:hypothetical protein [Nocardia sp. NPDC056100]|uniref:hypothetical protein n=1 Tax=Nocardia sp. NPDC056100 TaxID=3345712 RepID=UPI0035D6ABF3